MCIIANHFRKGDGYFFVPELGNFGHFRKEDIKMSNNMIKCNMKGGKNVL